jgi:hypothetical protein
MKILILLLFVAFPGHARQTAITPERKFSIIKKVFGPINKKNQDRNSETFKNVFLLPCPGEKTEIYLIKKSKNVPAKKMANSKLQQKIGCEDVSIHRKMLYIR